MRTVLPVSVCGEQSGIREEMNLLGELISVKVLPFSRDVILSQDISGIHYPVDHSGWDKLMGRVQGDCSLVTDGF